MKTANIPMYVHIAVYVNIEMSV